MFVHEISLKVCPPTYHIFCLRWYLLAGLQDFIVWNLSLAQGPAADGSVGSSSLSVILSIAALIALAIVHGSGSTTVITVVVMATTTATAPGNVTFFNVIITNNYAYPCTVSLSSSYCVVIVLTTNTTKTITITTPSLIALGEVSNCI